MLGKQKIEIEVTMENAKRRTKALTVAVGQRGVISAQIDGEKIVVIGDGTDSVALTVMLRKKMKRFADLISVSAVEEEKEKEKEEKKEAKTEAGKQPAVICPCQHAMAPQPVMFVTPEPHCDPCCCVM